MNYNHVNYDKSNVVVNVFFNPYKNHLVGRMKTCFQSPNIFFI